ncbi:MAG: hypothetical protein QHC88_02570 [Achromobacter sp.]|uniref:hypothetical protein n=1 Tax=Achromobacter sp. TaxID=134375 RepID=UPI0029AAEFB7|nr:hypothetical protein [Achromobacter sp.]MDX3984115.1 hypothetical protein [Achromobacter sp.]
MPTLRSVDWFLIGAISTQDRCKSVLLHNKKSLNITNGAFLKIIDEPSVFSAKSEFRMASMQSEIQRVSTNGVEILELRLLGSLARVQKKLAGWIAQSNGNVILDISCLPERFCFPILRWLHESRDVNNLVVTYMLPESYTREDLGYDAQDWGQLPTFVNSDANGKSVENVIVGVGFLPYSLPDWLKKTYATPNFKISLLMPFPAAPSSVDRSWEFIRRIEKDLSLRDDRQIIRIAANDLSGAFQRIENITRGGQTHSVFAPYGPKAHSIAMALHALRHSCEVYFTQPTYYHPEYSTGIALDQGLPAGHAYAIRVSGYDFY